MKSMRNLPWSSPFLLVCVLVLASGCSSTQVEFKEPGASDDLLPGAEDIDPEPSTVGEQDEPVIPEEMPRVEEPVAQGQLWIPSQGDFALRDQQTGSLWNVRGQAFEGPLKGAVLEQRPAFTAFWFAWSVFYDGSLVWNRQDANRSGSIEPSGNCTVPCDEIRQACSGRDCIPALDHDGRDNRPAAQMVAVDDVQAAYLKDNDQVLGVFLHGQARAYPHNLLWWHEIHNDRINDTEYSVTFCPLTGSGIVYSGFQAGRPIDFGVSGNLYNSNLVMFDRDGQTLWSQMLGQGVSGGQVGQALTMLPVVETTWGRWRQMHPQTLVASDQTGYRRDYTSYPYGDYRTNHANTFRPTNPQHDSIYPGKALVLGLVGEEGAKAYAFDEMGTFGDRVVVNDTFGGDRVVVVYEAQFLSAVPFSARLGETTLTFEGVQTP